ncbi:hypothetical protein GCM10010331_44550 [Streptomyces xanthochromogenes]|nr:hypothetical protein GCM10010331_44550 [Streptomyces xanthochromogenes]
MAEWVEKDLTSSEEWDGRNREWETTIDGVRYIVVGVLTPGLPYFEPDGALRSPAWQYTGWVCVPDRLPSSDLVCLELSELEEAQAQCERHADTNGK